MNTPDSDLDKHLRALFGGLDTGADFDTRLMARLRTESRSDSSEQAMRARAREQARYRSAVLEVQSWRRSMLQLLTVDTLGIAVLVIVAVVTAWRHLTPEVMGISRLYGPYIAMVIGILFAAVPLLGMWAEQTRRPIRLL